MSVISLVQVVLGPQSLLQQQVRTNSLAPSQQNPGLIQQLQQPHRPPPQQQQLINQQQNSTAAGQQVRTVQGVQIIQPNQQQQQLIQTAGGGGAQQLTPQQQQTKLQMHKMLATLKNAQTKEQKDQVVKILKVCLILTHQQPNTVAVIN